MTDVRLTATNPDDSSVVPVACNSRGELLITDPTIEQISNNLQIDGTLIVNPSENEDYQWSLTEDLLITAFRSNESDGSGAIRLTRPNYAAAVINFAGVATWKINWDGTANATNLKLMLEPDNPAHYITTKRDGESDTQYTGPVLDVAEELLFLRAQVRALMEKLKMSPEGGWPVWDGESAS